MIANSLDLRFTVAAASFAAAGVAFGWGYFAALRWAVHLYRGGGGALSAGVLTIARLAAALGFFTLAAHWGAGPLLAALVGFLLARTAAVRSARSHAAW